MLGVAHSARHKIFSDTTMTANAVICFAPGEAPYTMLLANI
jgi:hypothetical protein